METHKILIKVIKKTPHSISGSTDHELNSEYCSKYMYYSKWFNYSVFSTSKCGEHV